MSGFDDRKNAFENKFAHDEELKFRIEARRNKLLGLWAAEILGKDGDAYAKEVIASDFEEAGDEDVFNKVRADLGDDVSDDDIREKMVWLLGVAEEQITSE
ncbi:MAG: DUF1476 domain-containing protein [Lentilitoribacter sp.]|mmetsp:Transcript_24346/g.31727  ORF Transcript_24346/g.31727 Transcript_24346/m.31727 type:complete len:101 (-) Transcript_24346:63-365(-)|eukprot:CAMPEP_0195259658 /NCGR_PEP_ID=MMETSP0706-20130129/8098_1 /TAXON_ID=33640 /ORGANISM="Asterionellopsis glacialis, Strain CCMP134" /LENGTH=100 /DNA_ID=CAMNT_0040313205 /DNA_START=34 /DNA_END=336 /DNA_ORIENTATION=+